MGKLYSALLLLSAIWGTSFLFIKLLLTEISPIGLVFWRCLFGAVTLLIIILLKREKISLGTIPFVPVFSVGLFNNALPFMLISYSELTITSSLASIINATTPICTVLIGFFFFSQKLHKGQWLGIIIGFIGIVILVDFRFTDLMNQNAAGIVGMIGAALCYGLGAQLSKRYLQRMSVTSISFSTLATASFITFILLLFTNPSELVFSYSSTFVFSLIGLGILGSGFAYLLYYFMVKEGGPEFASIVTYIVPGMAIMWGYVLLEEAVTGRMVFGLVFILAGIYLASRVKKSSSSRAVTLEKHIQ
ncbi:drug/metabolite transporter (DMT)-like permease [Bacillus fengqiuensis]|nr:drug/metabolite transporter (DMT)-like permease [Bacillus fengqiuensis]